MDNQNESPEMLSLLGYSLARESGQIKKGIQMCQKAISLNPHNCDHYLHLGRLFLLAGKKAEAIKVFRIGLRIRKDARIIAELKQLGIRKSPPFQSLGREHLLNRLAGKVMVALRLR
jgi:tetratricopeptide (TPR) repeat protein